MVSISIIKNNKPFTLTIALDGVPWRHIHTKIFGINPSFEDQYVTNDIFLLDFKKKEYLHVLQFVLKRLSYKSEFSLSLKKMLIRLYVSTEIIDLTLNECQRLGYINDEEWIESFIKGQISKNYGPQMIFFKLINKGVSREIAKAYLKNHSFENSSEQIKDYLDKKFKNKNLKDPSYKRRAIASLTRKGFLLDDIYHYMNAL